MVHNAIVYVETLCILGFFQQHLVFAKKNALFLTSIKHFIGQTKYSKNILVRCPYKCITFAVKIKMLHCSDVDL